MVFINFPTFWPIEKKIAANLFPVVVWMFIAHFSYSSHYIASETQQKQWQTCTAQCKAAVGANPVCSSVRPAHSNSNSNSNNEFLKQNKPKKKYEYIKRITRVRQLALFQGQHQPVVRPMEAGEQYFRIFLFVPFGRKVYVFGNFFIMKMLNHLH